MSRPDDTDYLLKALERIAESLERIEGLLAEMPKATAPVNQMSALQAPSNPLGRDW